MKKLYVKIEEHLCKTIEVEVSDDATLDSDEVRKKVEAVHDDYRNGKIILTSDDYTGVPCFCEEMEDGMTTEWYE